MPNIFGPVLPLGVDQHNAVANGNYYCFARNQTGFPTQASLGLFTDANSFVIMYNTSGPNGPSVYLDWITLICTVAGTGGTSLMAAGGIDFLTNRVTTLGNNDYTANITNPNGNFAVNSCVQFISRPNVGATKTSLRRLIFGNRELLPTNPAPGDTMTIKFGGNNCAHTIATSGINYSTTNVPKAVVPPMGCFCLGIWLPGPQTVASSYIIEAGWIEA